MKKKQGISLIVLVITIIVIVILAVAVILSIANNNPIENAKNAVEENNKATLKEAANLEYATMYANAKINGEVIDTDAMTTAIRTNLMNQGFSGDEVAKVTITENGLKIKDTTESEEATFTKTGDLAIGCEVTASNGEEFYVIGGDTVGTEISTSTQEIILLSKYCLKIENFEITLKQDITGDSNMGTFSSTNYWSSVEGITYPADLNDEEKFPIPSGCTSVITIAKEYGKSLGATGRLMTYEEASTLQTKHSDILYGNGTQNGYLDYWLGTASRDDMLWIVSGYLDGISFYSVDGSCGVRPIITVSKSLIK